MPIGALRLQLAYRVDRSGGEQTILTIHGDSTKKGAPPGRPFSG